MILEQERKDVIEYCRLMQTRQLTKGTGGNISIYNRKEGLVAISPSGVEYSTMTPEQVVITDPSGKVVDGKLKPSSELGMHLSIYENRDDINAIVHTHSTYAAVLACAHLELPAIHYLIGFGGADKIPCIPYYTYGSKELADAAGKKFGDVKGLNALLLGNHGLICGGPNIGYAFSAAEEIEFTSELYYRVLTIGKEPQILSKEEMDIVQKKFQTYGQ